MTVTGTKTVWVAYTIPQPAPDIQALVNAAVAAALEKAEAVAVKFGKGKLTGSKESAQVILQELRAIPRDTSALDEYKADIDAHKGALILSASKCKDLKADTKRLVDAFDAYWKKGSLADVNKVLSTTKEIKAKYNL